MQSQTQLAVWVPYTRQSSNKLKPIQKRVAHFVMCDYHQISSVSNMLLRLNWNTIETNFKMPKTSDVTQNYLQPCGYLITYSYITYRTRHTRGSDLRFILPDMTIDVYKSVQFLCYNSIMEQFT